MDPRITDIVPVNSISERLESLADADGYVFFTGGIGTLAEFAFIWHSLQVAADFNKPVILISRGWKKLLTEIKRQQMIKHKYYRIVHLCERAKEAVAIVTNDYSIKYDDPGSIFYKEAVFCNLDGIIVESPEEEFSRLCENKGYFFRKPDVIAAFRRAERLRSPHEDEFSYASSILESLGVTAKPAADLAAHLSQVKPIPELHGDAIEMLQYLKASGFLIGVLSSRPPVQLQEILSAHALSDMLDFVGTLDPSAEKPAKGFLEEALAGSGLRKDGIVHIVDVFSADYPGRKAMGVDSIVLDRYLADLAGGQAVTIRSLKELTYLIRHPSV
jgi:FMN phosphatase YigB (HAD superfamily)